MAIKYYIYNIEVACCLLIVRVRFVVYRIIFMSTATASICQGYPCIYLLLMNFYFIIHCSIVVNGNKLLFIEI